MNLTDLTDVLRDHAELPDDAAHGPRMAGIRARVRTARRRRVVAAAACLVAVLGVAFAVTTPRQQESQPADPPASSEFPEYHEGTRIIEQTTGRAPAASGAVRFVPTTLDLRVFTRCEGDAQLLADLTVNGRPRPGGSCGYWTDDHIDWHADYGIEVGSPVTIVMSVGEQHGTDPTPGAVPADAVFTLAVGEAVAPEDYRFPPRPETLAPIDPSLDTINPIGRIDVRRADPEQPNGTWRTAVTLPNRQSCFHVAANTPGLIRVLVNDVEVVDYAKWTYETTNMMSASQDYWAERAAPGETVEITVVAERTSGDWAVALKGC
ncbi:MAG: hypothetical protein HOV94_04105 [Saccharothrix sp.]|nr:hypothetical protein [Saccharothrix sp.]